MPPIDLPLFPLGKVVLVPAMPLSLYIFEPRYREMIGRCLQGDRRFGAVLIREGMEVGETASPHDVGTVAEITAATLLDDGRYAIMAEGRERFRILERFYDRSYLHGAVELLDEPLGLLENVLPLTHDAHRLATRYITMVLKLEAQEEMEITLPADDPLDLSYKLVSLLQIPDPERQSLLEAETVDARLRGELQFLRRELLILDRLASLPAPAEHHFSLN